MKTVSLSKTSLSKVLLPVAFAGLLLTNISAPAQNAPCCPETNGVKFIALPNLNGGLDVKDSRNSIVLADDFFCNTPGPITDIHIWGSWSNDYHYTSSITNFWLGIYDDVPATTNGTGGLIPSHPGTNLLWSQSFPLSQFCETYYTNGNESFYDPATGSLGQDSQVWYYCFYPTTPFFQQGRPDSPTNYWLAARAQLQPGDGTLYGWKTAICDYNEAAVWGTVGPDGLPKGNWQSLTNPTTELPLNLAFKITTAVQPIPCVETNGVKYDQEPNLYNGGYDVWNSSPQPVQLAAADGPWWLADDFVCTNAGFITDIHLWGSWQYNNPLSNSITFQLYVFDDVPTNAVNPHSHPGTNVLWHQTFAPGSYAEGVWPAAYVNETFLDPSLPQILGPESNVWYFCFYPTGLYQNGSPGAPSNYWLAAFAELPRCVTNVFGWKTTTSVQHDMSVRAQWMSYNVPPPTNAWQPNSDVNGQPFDLAFKLTTQTNPPLCCPETNGLKYIQHPNLINGVDVDATINFGWVVADDFLCTNSGPISDIHLWGSWLNDQVDYTASYTLTIWSDVPAPPTGGAWSHPGVPLWSQTFTPGNYAICPGPKLPEGFFDPNTTGGLTPLGTSTNLYYLCFYAFPTNTFCQAGTPTAQTNYWLSVSALTTIPTAPDYFGWKSSSDAYGDAAVAANAGGSYYPPPSAWKPLSDPSSGGPLNLAFKVTTATNSTVSITCPAAQKTIECGSTPSFDPPIVVGTNLCCHTQPGWIFYVVTNSTAPCHQVYTAYWTITNCHGGVLQTCTQTVTVEDTNAPFFLNCTDLVLDCGDHSYTNPPVAYDACCGTNVTVTLQDRTITNNNGCGWTVLQTWRATDCCNNSALCVQKVLLVAQSVTLVVPNTNATVWGTGGDRYPFNIAGDSSSMRYQQVYDSSQFGAVPAGSARIAAIAFRVAEGWGAFAAMLPNVQINLSTTPKVPDSLDLTFANNVGPDDTIVHSGPLPLSSADGGNPAPFDIVIPLTTPFWYNPAAGNLLLDVRNIADGSSQMFDSVFTTGDSVSCVYAYDVTAPVGIRTGTDGLVTQFTLQPNTISLNCPSNIVVCTCSNIPVVVSWPTDVAIDYCTSVTVTSAPPSPALFLPNTTNTVVLSAHDACGNSNGCTFKVAVVRPVLGSITVLTSAAPHSIWLTWTSCGILQVSTYITNTNWHTPFVDVPGATSPYPVSTVAPPVARYYRLRCITP